MTTIIIKSLSCFINLLVASTDTLDIFKVLNVLSEGTVPSADVVATVRRLYETKLKVFQTNFIWCTGLVILCALISNYIYLLQDAAILIPLLPSFAKNEVFFTHSPLCLSGKIFKSLVNTLTSVLFRKERSQYTCFENRNKKD